MSLSLFTYYLDETNRLIKEATSITNFDEPEINLSLVRDKLVGTSSIIDLIIRMTNNNRNFEKFQIDVVSICQSMIIRLTQTLNNKIKSKINYKKDNKENNSNCNNYYDKNGSNYSKNSQNIRNYNLLPHSFKFTGSPRLFIDIAGNLIPKQVLWENIILPFKMPTEIRQKLFVGIRKMLGNVLLYGPPGNGKTVLAKATAAEANVTLYCVSPSDVLSKYHGESEKFIRNLFGEARKRHEKSIIFFDEFDSIAVARGMNESEGSCSRRLLSEILLQFNITEDEEENCLENLNFNSYDNNENSTNNRNKYENSRLHGNVVVIAATNRLEDMDEAIIRRFDSKVFIGNPSSAVRGTLVNTLMKDINTILNDRDIEIIVEKTEGWSCSDVEILCREAAMVPIREIYKIDYFSQSNAINSRVSTTPYIRPILASDFEAAFLNLLTHGQNEEKT